MIDHNCSGAGAAPMIPTAHTPAAGGGHAGSIPATGGRSQPWTDDAQLCQQGIECRCPLGAHAWHAIPAGPDAHMAVDKNGVPWGVRARLEADLGKEP